MLGFDALGILPLGGTDDIPLGIGLASEADIALPLSIAKLVTVGQALEEDEAFELSDITRSVSLGLAIEVDEALGLNALRVESWPFEDLCPRHLRIQPCAFPIGGGVSLKGIEPTIDSGNGYWRIVLGGFKIWTREHILIWRALEARMEGRGRTILLPFFDGKRAPWLGAPGGPITAVANAAVAKGATTIAINATSAGQLLVGQHFSAGHWGYRIIGISGQVGNVYTTTIWPKTREAIASGEALEFRNPVVRMRLEQDDGLTLPLHLLKRGYASVAFVEAVP